MSVQLPSKRRRKNVDISSLYLRQRRGEEMPAAVKKGKRERWGDGGREVECEGK